MRDCLFFYSRVFHFLSSGHDHFREVLAGKNTLTWEYSLGKKEQLCIPNFRTIS